MSATTPLLAKPLTEDERKVLRGLEAMRPFPLYFNHGICLVKPFDLLGLEGMYLLASRGLVEQCGNPFYPRWKISDAGTEAVTCPDCGAYDCAAAPNGEAQDA